MKFGFRRKQDDLGSARGRSLEGSFGRTDSLEDWVLENSSYNSFDTTPFFKSPFMLDELRKLDYALEGLYLQQLVRMPCTQYVSKNCKEEQFFALEDFLQTIVDSLWNTFWPKSGPAPFSICFPCYPGSKFYTVSEAITNERLGRLIGAAVAAEVGGNKQSQWDQAIELALFESDITSGVNAGFSSQTICEAIFYGFHLLLSRTVNKLDSVISSSVHVLVLDPKFGGVIKLEGNLSRLETSLCDTYLSVAKWVKHYAEIIVSPIDLIWDKLGNPNWEDMGTLQLLLATFNSILQWRGPPTKSIASLAADHSLHLQKRRMEYTGHVSQRMFETRCNYDGSHKRKDSCIKLNPGEVILVEDAKDANGFQVKEVLDDVYFLSYNVVSLDHPSGLFVMYLGAHPSQLEPSWEGMSQWYRVQRQTKILNIMKQSGISSKYVPELIASGRILHTGPCSKPSTSDRCDHPWCGTPVLVMSPTGEALSSIIVRGGPLSTKESLRCCRDILAAFSSIVHTNIQHSEIGPQNIIRVTSRRTEPCYVLVSWGRAVVDHRDSPGVNIQFSSLYALQNRKLCPSSDVESLIYVLYYASRGLIPELDSIESAIRWRQRNWAKRKFQQHLGEVSPILKAFADYVDSLCRTPFPVDYDILLRRLSKAVIGFEGGKSVEVVEVSLRLEDVAESSGTSGGGASLLY